jgi:hypothetical protein
MKRGNDGGRAVIALAAVLGAAALLGGCEAENPVIVNVSAAQARVVLTFAENPAKAAGDFDLELTLSVQGESQEPTEWQRTIAVRGWVAQGVLEVPPRVMVTIAARTVMDGQNYSWSGDVPPLEPGAWAPVRIMMYPLP